MKSNDELKVFFDKKIDEHKSIMDQLNFDLKNLVKDGKIESAMKHMVLKDKLLFHKACILTLDDVKKEICT